MDRLICSSPASYTIRAIPRPPPPRSERFGGWRLEFSPPARTDSKRVCYIICKYGHPSLRSQSPSSPGAVSPNSSAADRDSPRQPPVRHNFVERVGEVPPWQQKVVVGRTVVMVSALIVLTIHPLLAPAALATFAKPTGRLIRPELLSSAWTGFLAGCLHTLSGPDHLAALAPLSIGRSRLESAAVGALWGCGHDAGQVIFGLLFLLLKDRLHIEVIRSWGTRVVGLTLLVIGAMGIREATELAAPCVALENGEAAQKRKVGFATFATGIVHGLQPDALMMVLPALALPSRLTGAAFLAMFLVGTVVAMGSYTVFIGSCSQALKERVPRITEKLTWVSSLVAITLGLAVIVSQFFGFSLY